MFKRVFLSSALILALVGCCAAANATIQGFVKDGKTGTPHKNVRVDIFRTEDHSVPVEFTRTDDRGFYSGSVPSGYYYDVYVRMGDVNPTQRTGSAVEENGVYNINFDLYTESAYGNVVVEKYGFWVVVVTAVVILTAIAADQFFLRRKRILKELEQQQSTLQSRLDETKSVAGELSRAKHERSEIEYMINLTRIKYHKREIDEESFREIMRDYQKKLIELEAKINDSEGDAK